MGRLFKGQVLPSELVLDLRQLNPWWEGKPGPEESRFEFRRWPFDVIKRRIADRLAPIVLVRGPRQVGKTVLQFQIIEDLLKTGVSPVRILRVQFDELPSLDAANLEEPILRIIDWYEREILKRTLNEAAKEGEIVYVFFDEVQNLADWAPQLKFLVDSSTVSIVATGSSALRIQKGHDSLAGRVNPITVGPLLLREVAALRGFGDIPSYNPDNDWPAATDIVFWNRLKEFALDFKNARDQAFAAFSARGAYPLSQAKAGVSWSDLALQLNDKIITRVIEHDLRTSEKGRKRNKALLREVFTLAARYSGQAPEPATLAREVARALGADVKGPRIVNYLYFLDSSLIIRVISPLEIRLKKRRGSGKLTICDHALRASWLQEIIPLEPAAIDAAPHLSDLAGHVAENVVGYFLSSLPGANVAWLPRRGIEPEIDFVITIGDKRIPVEVKYHKRIDNYRDTEAIRAFVEKAAYNAVFGILVTRDDDTTTFDPRIVTLPLKSLLLLR